MRKLQIAILALAASYAFGCSGGETTDPRELPPLTAEHFAEIQAKDDAIDAEEGQSYVSPTSKGKSRARARLDH